jgi:DNA invertase Pin-like site-specific DNA recombinase
MTIQRQSLFDTAKKRRTAAYARVSTDSEEQENSYAAQCDYYTKYISDRSDWEFVSVYSDEGISAVNTKNRDGFKQMIADALAGRIDLIVTKSVSRFARNTVDSLTAVRNLKAAGVEVYFEKENIWTFDGKGELLITIMSSLAQEESRSISENVTWGKRRSFEQGHVYLPYGQFLGYEKGEDGRPQIVESEAKIVREIFSQFLHGMTPNAIARDLTSRGIP